MPDHLGADMRKQKTAEVKEEKEIKTLDEGDIALLKTYVSSLTGMWSLPILN